MTPIEAIAKSRVDFMGEAGETVAKLALAALTRTGYAVVPIKPTDDMLEELARIGDGPLISGAEVWGYMLAAAAAALADT